MNYIKQAQPYTYELCAYLYSTFIARKLSYNPQLTLNVLYTGRQA